MSPLSCTGKSGAPSAAKGVGPGETSGKPARATAAIFAGIVLLVGVITYSVPWRESESIFVPEHAELLGMTGTTAQRRAHQAALATIFFSALAGMALLRRRAWASSLPVRMTKAAIEPLAWWGMPIAGVFLALAVRRACILDILMALAAWFAVLAIARKDENKSLRLMLWIAAGAIFLCMMLPGMFGVPDLRHGGIGLRNIEWHYSITVMCGDRLAGGERLIEGVRVYYGLLVPTATAIFERAVGILSFGKHVRVVQSFQLVFALVFVAALFLMRPRHPLQVIVPLLMVLPWIHNNHIAVYLPNQSAWRSLGFPLGVALMLLAGEGVTGRIALIFGVAAGFLMLLNPETGICLTAGIFIFLVGGLRHSGYSAAIRKMGLFPVGLLSSLVAFIFLFRMGLGDWPFHSAGELLAISPILSKVGSGYGGLPFTGHLVPFFIFAHAVYIFLRQAFAWSGRALDVRERTVAAVAAVMILWSGFFINRPAMWNLWTYIVLYAFLIFEELSPKALEGSWKRLSRGRIPLGGILFALIVGPWMVSAFIKACSAVINHDRINFGERVDGEMVSDVLMAGATASELSKKAELLAGAKARQDSKNKLIYFTVNSYLMPKLSGVSSGVPFGSVFAEILTEKDYGELVALTLERDPGIILFDDPESPLAGLPPEKTFYAHLRSDLADKYRRTARTDGWEIWEKRK